MFLLDFYGNKGEHSCLTLHSSCTSDWFSLLGWHSWQLLSIITTLALHKRRAEIMYLDWPLTSMTEHMMLPTSAQPDYGCFDSFSLNCFIFVDNFPFQAFFTAVLFSSCCLLLRCGPADMEEWAASKTFPWIGYMWRSTIKGTFLPLRQKVLSQFTLDNVFFTQPDGKTLLLSHTFPLFE